MNLPIKKFKKFFQGKSKLPLYVVGFLFVFVFGYRLAGDFFRHLFNEVFGGGEQSSAMVLKQSQGSTTRSVQHNHGQAVRRRAQSRVEQHQHHNTVQVVQPRSNSASGQAQKPARTNRTKDIHAGIEVNAPNIVGKTVRQAIESAVQEIVNEYKEKLDEEFKKKYSQILESKENEGRPRRELSFDIEVGGEGRKSTRPVRTQGNSLPALVAVKAEVVYPDGRVLLKTDSGNLVCGAVINGWEITKIDVKNKVIYVRKEVVKEVPYKKLVKDERTGVKYHKTFYRTVRQVKKGKIRYVVRF